MENLIIRHGDVVFYRVNEIPARLKEIKINGNEWVAAYGETTGHKHLLTCERMTIRQAENGRYFLSLEVDGTLTHEEHKTIVLPKGDYLVGSEQEMDWFTKTKRKVID